MQYSRKFPQAKLDNEVNVPFLLNKHDDLSHNNSTHVILFNLKKIKIISGRKKDMDESVQKNRTLECKL